MNGNCVVLHVYDECMAGTDMQAAPQPVIHPSGHRNAFVRCSLVGCLSDTVRIHLSVCAGPNRRLARLDVS